MKHLHTLSLLAAATLTLAACTPSNTRPGSVPTAVKTGQSWVVTRPVVAAQVLDTCSRDSPAKHAGEVTGYWAPSRADIDMTKMIIDTAKPLGITVHDHIIIGKDGHASLKGLRLI